MDFESLLRSFSVLSSTMIPLPVGRFFFFSMFFFSAFLLLLESLDFLLLLVFPEFAMRHWIKRSCDRTRCFSKRLSTDCAASAAAFFLAMCSSISLRRLVFSSLKASKDCSKSVVNDFLRKRLFFACFRFLSLLHIYRETPMKLELWFLVAKNLNRDLERNLPTNLQFFWCQVFIVVLFVLNA